MHKTASKRPRHSRTVSLFILKIFLNLRSTTFGRLKVTSSLSLLSQRKRATIHILRFALHIFHLIACLCRELKMKGQRSRSLKRSTSLSVCSRYDFEVKIDATSVTRRLVGWSLNINPNYPFHNTRLWHWSLCILGYGSGS